MNFREAEDIFQNEEWSESESALFYYRWFGEEFLFDLVKQGIKDNPEEFILLVNKIRRGE